MNQRQVSLGKERLLLDCYFQVFSERVACSTFFQKQKANMLEGTFQFNIRKNFLALISTPFPTLHSHQEKVSTTMLNQSVLHHCLVGMEWKEILHKQNAWVRVLSNHMLPTNNSGRFNYLYQSFDTNFSQWNHINSSQAYLL